MQTRFTILFINLLFILILSSSLNNFAQRNPTPRGDDRLPKRFPNKNETVRERPNETPKTPEVINSPPPNNYNPPEQHLYQPPKYKPIPICGEPPYQPNPHYPNPPETVVIDYKLEGKEKLEDGDYEIALEYLTQAIWLDSNDYELYYFKGIAEIKLQFYEEALEDLDYFLDYIIYEPDGYFQRGLAKFYLNKKAKAKEDFLIAADMEHKLAISILKRYF